MRRDIAGRARERVVAPGPAEAVGAVEDRKVVSGVGQLDSHRDAAGARPDDADFWPVTPIARSTVARAGFLDQDEDHTPRIDEPGGANPRDIRDSADQEAHSLALEFGAGGVEVLTDQPDVRKP